MFFYDYWEYFMRVLILFLLLLVNAVAQSQTVTVTVGSDGACDYSSITAASFNAPSGDELVIRVAKNYSVSSIQILDDRSTSIFGGYDNCSDTSANGRTILDGGSFTGPIFVLSEAIGADTASRTNLYLWNLEISNGNSNTSGGGISLTGSWYLSLWNVDMHDNTSQQDGGAIYVKASTDLSAIGPNINIRGNSILSNNSADNGGAIACDGLGNGALTGLFIWDTQISFNQASQNGGGVFVTNDCRYGQYEGGLFQGVLLNDAAGFGGGIYGSNGSFVSIQSNNFDKNAAAIVSNSAANGGGIAVSNNATLLVEDAVISSNTATSTGGAIRSNQGNVIIQRVKPGAQCHSEVRCSRITDNSATGTSTSFSGGGAIATFGGTLEVTGTYFEGNSANYGSAIRARFMPMDGFNTPMTMVGNVFAGNSGAQQVVYLDETSADIAFSTFVDNEDMTRVIELAYPTTSLNPHEVNISGSIFDQAGDTVESAELTTAGVFPNGDCNRNEFNSTGDLMGEPRSTTATVNFENRVGGDYRIVDNTSMVDYCDGSFLGAGSNFSANGLPRPVNSSIANIHGIYDLGGLERYDSDLIFKNGFD
jgi:predicted outer membrane repeat protein